MNNPVWFGKYRIIKALGKGGSGEVFLAEHIKLSSLCAIKRIHKGNPLHEQLLHEAVILKSLSHPCIPVIYDFEEEKEYSYIIEQYMEGILLKDYIKQEGRLKESLVLSIGTSICDLFLYLYSLNNPVLYLDLNPGNIILNSTEVKLIDFGGCIYKERAEERRFSLGTKGFFSPELKSGTPDERSDVYAIGALLHYLVMGGVPYGKGNLQPDRAAKKFYSDELLKIIQKALRYHSAFRYTAVAELRKKILEQNRKMKGGNAIPRESLKIAIAAAQTRAGATHLALLLTNYLNSKGIKCLYWEKNSSGHLRTILNSRNARLKADGIWYLKRSFYLPFSKLSSLPETEGYPVILYDMGTAYTEGEEFKKADIRLLVTGAKDWEIENIVRVEDKLQTAPHKILLSFISGRQYRDFCKAERDSRHLQRPCQQYSRQGCSQHSQEPCPGYSQQYVQRYYRIPYEPDPFTDRLSGEMKDFLEELLM